MLFLSLEEEQGKFSSIIKAQLIYKVIEPNEMYSYRSGYKITEFGETIINLMVVTMNRLVNIGLVHEL